jgi:hypothetical protein
MRLQKKLQMDPMEILCKAGHRSGALPK